MGNSAENKKKLEHLKEMLGEEKFYKLAERFAGMTLYFSKKGCPVKVTARSKYNKKPLDGEFRR
jgi:hypothetical protein